MGSHCNMAVLPGCHHSAYVRPARQLLHRQRASHFRPAPRHARCQAAPSLKQAGSAAAPPAAEVPLPKLLRDATAVLTSASGSKVYVLGVSHVSKESCTQIEELVRLVRPDIVLVELCKERVPLLVNPDEPAPSLWHAARQSVSGLPAGRRGWPSAAQLLAAARCRGGAPVSAVEIEDDAVALLATGLFGLVGIAAKPPQLTAAPSFLLGPGGRGLQTVAPLAEIEFRVGERVLPRLAALEVVLEVGDAAALADAIPQVQSSALQSAASGTPAVSCYLAARQALLDLFPPEEAAGLEVVFSGVESGSAQAVVRRVPAGQQRSLTGLEGSAAKGVGKGIEPFQRRAARQGVRIGGSSGGSVGLQIDARALAAAAAAAPASAGAAAAAAAGAAAAVPQTLWRPWTEAELQQGAAAGTAGAAGGAAGQGGSGLSAAFATAITQAYAKFQAQAGRRVGIAPGAAWQTALRAAAACGAQQVLLGDRPSGTTAQRLADGLWSKCSPFLLGSLPAAAASAIIVSSSLDAGPATPLAAAAAALLPVAAAAWPIAAPLVEISRFAGMSAAQIEETVRPKEPVQASSPSAPIIKLWGEDALLDWPGAMDPVIHERDAYMAKTLAAAANGGPAAALTPAFTLSPAAAPAAAELAAAAGAGAAAGAEGADGRRVFRYVMPQGGNTVVCPPGMGDGVYEALPAGRTVVGVVGTAHVRGICREWEAAQRDADLSKYV